MSGIKSGTTATVSGIKSGTTATVSGIDSGTQSGLSIARGGGSVFAEALRKWGRVYHSLIDIPKELPPGDSVAYKNPEEKMRALQILLSGKFPPCRYGTGADVDCMKPPERTPNTNFCGPIAGKACQKNSSDEGATKKSLCAPSPAEGSKDGTINKTGIDEIRLQTYQKAMIAPLMILDELLIVAGTGTGKSLMYLEAMAALPAISSVLQAGFESGKKRPVLPTRCYVIVKDQPQALNQLYELLKAPSWRPLCPIVEKGLDKDGKTPNAGEFISLPGSSDEKSRSTKLVNFLSYTQAGNISKKGLEQGKCELDDMIIIMDEIHTLVTLEGIDPAWRHSVIHLGDWVAKRKYGKFLGLTATPPIENFGKLALFLNYFLPKEKQLEVSKRTEVVDDKSVIVTTSPQLDGMLETTPPTEDAQQCGIPGNRALSAKFREALVGMNICLYASDNDRGRFPAFEFETPKVVDFVVPGIAKRQKMERTKDGKTKSFKDRVNGSSSHSYFGKLLDDYAKNLVTPPASSGYKGLKSAKKALIFISNSDSNVVNLANALQKLGVDAKPMEKAELKRAEGYKKAFNCGVRGYLVANTAYATGHTFLGADELHQLQPVGAEIDLQLKGRVRRFCSHGNLPASEWFVRHYVWNPLSANKEELCDSVLARYIDSEKRVLESLTRVLWEVSFTYTVFREHAPHFMPDPKKASVEKGDDAKKTTKLQRFSAAASYGTTYAIGTTLKVSADSLLWLTKWLAKHGYASSVATWYAFFPTLRRWSREEVMAAMSSAKNAATSGLKDSMYKGGANASSLIYRSAAHRHQIMRRVTS